MDDMRTRLLLTLMTLMLASLPLTGCNAKLKEENRLLLEENEEIRSQLADRNAALEAARMDLRDRDQQIAQMQRDMQNQPEPQTTGFEGISGVTGKFGAGEVMAVVESDVLFDSGKATLKSSAKRALDEVANVLNSTYAGRDVRVKGHTDTDPIRKSGHASNYHLGFERAYAVRQYLISRGVSSDRLALMSFGPDQPLGSKSQSRRVEIAVVLN
jgi:chemotaxis protein MotB